MSTVAQALQSAARSLVNRSSSPRLDAEVLLAKILGLPRSGLIAHGNEPIALDCEQAYASLIAQRLDGQPVAYLTGIREFWSLPIAVSPDVLVPRPETELLVELALQRLPEVQPASVLDLGTGSGAIALAIASERPRAAITGIDISAAALNIAAQNSASLRLPHIDWRLGSWFGPVQGERFDLIAANPPYVAAADPALAALAREPTIALTSGPSGLEALSAIAAEAGMHLHPGGWLLMEHGADQAADVRHMLERHGFSGVRTHLDFSDKPRVTLGTFHSPNQEPS
jgi:release factor glutamine methyltransferase